MSLTFLNHEYDVTGGLASALHFNVTFSCSDLVTVRLGSSFDSCTDTVGGSINGKIKNLTKKEDTSHISSHIYGNVTTIICNSTKPHITKCT